MRFRRNGKPILIVLAVYVTFFPCEAHAYLDPGTGSLIIQSVIAAVAAVGYGLRLYWGRIRRWFGRPRGDETIDAASPGEKN